MQVQAHESMFTETKDFITSQVSRCLRSSVTNTNIQVHNVVHRTCMCTTDPVEPMHWPMQWTHYECHPNTGKHTLLLSTACHHNIGSTLWERVVITQDNTSWMFSHTKLDHKLMQSSWDDISSRFSSSSTSSSTSSAPSILLLLSGLWLSPDNYWGNAATRAKSWRRCLG